MVPEILEQGKANVRVPMIKPRTLIRRNRLTAREACEFLRVSRRWLGVLLKDYGLPGRKRGTWQFRVAELIRWRERNFQRLRGKRRRAPRGFIRVKGRG